MNIDQNTAPLSRTLKGKLQIYSPEKIETEQKIVYKPGKKLVTFIRNTRPGYSLIDIGGNELSVKTELLVLPYIVTGYNKFTGKQQRHQILVADYEYCWDELVQSLYYDVEVIAVDENICYYNAV
jgi:hypothetical protein